MINIYNISYKDKIIYIGSTKNTLIRRKYQHKFECKRRVNYPIYKFINEVGWNNIEFNEIACCNPDNRFEMEGKIYEMYKSTCLNKSVPGRSVKESKINWGSKNPEYQKIYRGIHKEKARAYQKAYRAKMKALKGSLIC